MKNDVIKVNAQMNYDAYALYMMEETGAGEKIVNNDLAEELIHFIMEHLDEIPYLKTQKIDPTNERTTVRMIINLISEELAQAIFYLGAERVIKLAKWEKETAIFRKAGKDGQND